MRPVLAAILAAAILGSVAGFQWFQNEVRARHRSASSSRPIDTQGRLYLQIATTYRAAADRFYGRQPSSVTAQLDGGAWRFQTQEPLAPGQLLTVAIDQGLHVGRHEVFVRIAGSPDEPLRPRAARVRISDGVRVLAEATWFSNAAGAPLAGVVRFEYSPIHEDHSGPH